MGKHGFRISCGSSACHGWLLNLISRCNFGTGSGRDTEGGLEQLPAWHWLRWRAETCFEGKSEPPQPSAPPQPSPALLGAPKPPRTWCDPGQQGDPRPGGMGLSAVASPKAWCWGWNQTPLRGSVVLVGAPAPLPSLSRRHSVSSVTSGTSLALRQDSPSVPGRKIRIKGAIVLFSLQLTLILAKGKIYMLKNPE